jgi:tetratricopeptide (TPR) repeat protein
VSFLSDLQATFKEERAMRFRLFQAARQFSLLGLVLGALSATTAVFGQGTPDDRYQTAPQQARPNTVRFADGSALPAGDGPSILTAAPAASPMPTLAPRPLEGSTAPKPLEPPPDMTPAAQPPSAAGNPGPASPGATLTPVPDAKYLGPAEIEVTSFHGITPGTSNRVDVEKAWGKPKQSKKLDAGSMQLYSVDPFPRVEVAYSSDNKVTSLVIRFDHGFPSGQVADQLELSKVQPVLVSNEMGEVLGQAYPERGVLFSFEPATDPSKALKKVTHIVLEPITAEPFVLRAETNIDTRPEFSLHDAEQAVKLQPGNARAQWLKSRALTSLGQEEQAVAAAAEAVRIEPRDARYQVTKAQALQRAGHIAEAIPEAEKAIALSEQRPHVKARAICLLGDLKGTGVHPDYKQALQLHTKALQAADALATDKHPAIRIAAKEVLLDAHLGALHDIAWGAWREKERSAENWIAKAAEIARDIIKTEDGTEEYLFRVSARALAADVGLQGKLDPLKWAKDLVRSGEVMIAAAPELGRKNELQWQVAMSLYDAMQVYQMRGNPEEALRQGELAIRYLEKSGRQNKSPSAAYLLGRAYFRMGAVYANNRKDHRAAVEWFEKAVPLLGRTPPQEAMVDLGRLGDSFVSMGVSYWMAGSRKKAIALTEHGTDLIEEAVRRGSHDRSVLVIPYSNLAAMKREMSDSAGASRAQELAEKAKGMTIR